jgi:hypothetical protein
VKLCVKLVVFITLLWCTVNKISKNTFCTLYMLFLPICRTCFIVFTILMENFLYLLKTVTFVQDRYTRCVIKYKIYYFFCSLTKILFAVEYLRIWYAFYQSLLRSDTHKCVFDVNFYLVLLYVHILALTLRNRASYIQDGHTATLQTPHFIYFFNKYRYWIF